MELDFRHSELLANPVHLRAIHIDEQYGRFGQMSTADTNFVLMAYVSDTDAYEERQIRSLN